MPRTPCTTPPPSQTLITNAQCSLTSPSYLAAIQIHHLLRQLLLPLFGQNWRASARTEMAVQSYNCHLLRPRPLHHVLIQLLRYLVPRFHIQIRTRRHKHFILIVVVFHERGHFVNSASNSFLSRPVLPIFVDCKQCLNFYG